MFKSLPMSSNTVSSFVYEPEPVPTGQGWVISPPARIVKKELIVDDLPTPTAPNTAIAWWAMLNFFMFRPLTGFVT